MSQKWSTFTYHRDVIAIKEDLVQFGYPPSLWCDFTGSQVPKWTHETNSQLYHSWTSCKTNELTILSRPPGPCLQRWVKDVTALDGHTWRSRNARGNILKDTDKVVKAQQGADDLLVGFHHYVNSGADAFVHKLCREKQNELDIYFWLDLLLYIFTIVYFHPLLGKRVP